MNKKLLFPILTLVLVVIAAFAAYSMAKPKPKVTTKINGTIYILQKQFTLNLKGGQYATLTVALLLPPTQSVGVTSPSDPPPTGFGSLTDEAVIRAIITNDVTDQPANALLTQPGRKKIEATILSNIRSQTDTKVTNIYFTDLAVQ
jgi:flagellar basal body-associated protein FliL